MAQWACGKLRLTVIFGVPKNLLPAHATGHEHVQHMLTCRQHVKNDPAQGRSGRTTPYVEGACRSRGDESVRFHGERTGTNG